jgi:phospholipase/carboxylesterase
VEFVTIDRDAVIWSTPEADRAGRDLVVLLHGHLGREGDLFQLSPYLPLDHVIAAPRGPRTEGTGYSWFDVEAARPAPLDAAADDLADWLADVSVGARTVTLFGYSQGGVLALQTLRRHPELVDEVVMLSGMLEDDPRAGDAAVATRHPAVFWGRGTVDELVPATGIERTREWLLKNTELTERIYEDVGHWITDAELADVNTFLRREDRA